MNNKILYAVTSLKTWSERILNREDDNIKDYRRFCRELLPHLNSLAASDGPAFSAHVTIYQQNMERLQKAMKQTFFTTFLGNTVLSQLFDMRKEEELREAIRQIRSNAGNLEHALMLTN